MTLTTCVLLVATAVLIAYDIWTDVERGSDTTISWDILTLGRRYLIIPVVAGVLIGHFFWSQCA